MQDLVARMDELSSCRTCPRQEQLPLSQDRRRGCCRPRSSTGRAVEIQELVEAQSKAPSTALRRAKEEVVLRWQQRVYRTEMTEKWGMLTSGIFHLFFLMQSGFVRCIFSERERKPVLFNKVPTPMIHARLPPALGNGHECLTDTLGSL